MKIDEITVTAAELGEFVGVTRERIGQFAKMGVVPKAAKGVYPLKASVRAIVDWRADETRRASKSAAASRKDDARTRLFDLEIAQRENRLIDLNEHDAVLDEIVAMMVASLNALPARITRDVAIRRKAESEIHGMRTKLAETMAKRGRELASSGRLDHR